MSINRDAFTRAFRPDQIRTRKRDGKELHYVEATAVLERLNEASDHGWSFQVQRYDVFDSEVVVLGKLDVGGVTKMDIGSAPLTRDASGKKNNIGEDLKAAVTDCIKRCGRLFGIGLQLHADEAPVRSSSPVRHEEERLTERQLGALHAACKRKGWRSDRLTGLVGARFKKNDVKALTRGEASSLISEISGSNGH